MSVGNFLKPSAIAEAELPVVNFSQKMNTWKEDLNKFLHTRFYTHHKILRMQYKAYRLLRDLFEEYIERPPQLPPGVQKRIKEGRESLPRIVTDYIAGMTDRFALDEHRKLFLPYEY
jgi:dGTPase